MCPYCDFAVRRDAPAARADFVAGVIAEAGLWREWEVPIDTVYLGGGTPSRLDPGELTRMLEAIDSCLPVEPRRRLSLEANPEDVEAGLAGRWRALGVTTVSLGVQSFVGSELRALGRRHDPARARASVRICLELGFPTVSVDLIFGLPGQSAADLERSLDAVAELAPHHVSCYQLTIHEHTTFGRWRGRGKLREMPEDDQATLYELIHRRLGEAGFLAYEVSNFARAPEHRSRHNLKYWRHTPYLGLGPSAHSFDGGARWWNLRQLGPYREALARGRRPIEGSESLAPSALALERLMLGLRMVEGIDLADFRRRFGADLIGANEALVEELERGGYLRVAGGRLIPTVAGLAVADGLAARFRIED